MITISTISTLMNYTSFPSKTPISALSASRVSKSNWPFFKFQSIDSGL